MMFKSTALRSFLIEIELAVRVFQVNGTKPHLAILGFADRAPIVVH